MELESEYKLLETTKVQTKVSLMIAILLFMQIATLALFIYLLFYIHDIKEKFDEMYVLAKIMGKLGYLIGCNPQDPLLDPVSCSEIQS